MKGDSGVFPIALLVLALLAAPAVGQTPAPAEPAVATVPHQFSELREVTYTARDGVSLVANVMMPSTPGPFPTILVRSPYGARRDSEVRGSVTRTNLTRFVDAGYAVVVTDVRGRGASGGEFSYHPQEEADGFDTVEWVAAQPWSNGKVGTWGVSYLGLTQAMAMKANPPHLVCAMPGGVPGRHVHYQNPYIGVA
jgi:predicted acyl esterase